MKPFNRLTHSVSVFRFLFSAFRFLFSAFCFLLLALTMSTQAQAADLTVMSYNIRYGTAQDGENSWPNRREMLMDLLKEQNADLIGVQEALYFQLEEIKTSLPRYEYLGVGRDDGKQGGEYAAIFYRRDRFTPLQSGTFWFSETPTAPGSKHWGNQVTRICTWAKIKDRKGQELWLFNVHLDHESQPSREKSVALLLQRIKDLARDEPVLICGDFNVGEGNPAVAAVVENGFRDTFRDANLGAGIVGTFSGFKLHQTSGEKIDYIFASRQFRTLDAQIVRTQRYGRYPSDHFPVVAKLKLQSR